MEPSGTADVNLPGEDVSRQLFTDLLLDTIDVGIVWCDADGGNLRRNQAGGVLLGLADMDGPVSLVDLRTSIDVFDGAGTRVDPDDFPLARAVRGETDGDIDFTIGSCGGPYRDVVIRGSQMVAVDGGVVGAVVAISDVTVERTTVRELGVARKDAVDTHALLAAVMDTSPDLTFVTDIATGGLVYASPGKTILGMTSSQLTELGPDIGKLLHPEDQARLRALNTAAQELADGAILHLRYRAKHGAGPWRWLDRRVTPFRRSASTGQVIEVLGVVRDVTEEHDTQLALRDSEAMFRALVTQVVDYAIIGLNPAGQITSWNAGARRVKGYSAEQAIGRHFSMFYDDEDRQDGLPGGLLATARTQGRVAHTGWRVRRDGSRFWGNVVITALRDEHGALSGYVKVTQDLTTQHQLAEAQESLFAAVTHDLRNPVFAIQILAELLARSGSEADHQENLRGLQLQATHLGNLVDGLFDYAKNRSGPAVLTLVPLAVARLASTCAAAFRAVSPQHGINVQDSDAMALADRTALTRILDNLLGNAVRYSPAGTPITVTVDEVGEVVRIAVSDHGRGIAAEDIDTIFGEFNRGRLARDDDGGSGLGLASVQRLTTLQGGRVWIDSQVGHGTTVTVELARAPSGYVNAWPGGGS